MKRFYVDGFQDLRAEYLPSLEYIVKTLGIFNVILMLEREYKEFYNQNLMSELTLEPELTVVPTPDWFSIMLDCIGFTGVLEWLADIISVVDGKGLTRDGVAVSLLETQHRAKSYSLLLHGLGQIN